MADNKELFGLRLILQKETFIKLFVDLRTVGAAASGVGVTRKTIYNWLEKDSDFAQAFMYAKMDKHDTLESEAFKRALGGSDGLLKFLLQSYNPEVFDRRNVDATLKRPITVKVIEIRKPSQVVDGEVVTEQREILAIAEVDGVQETEPELDDVCESET